MGSDSPGRCNLTFGLAGAVQRKARSRPDEAVGCVGSIISIVLNGLISLDQTLWTAVPGA